MQYRPLGRSGVRVSALCLGTMMFGDRTSEAESNEIVAAGRDAGINFIDTADVYSKGESERITGRAITTDRNRWVVATKVANAIGSDTNRRGLSRRWLFQAIDESLERLGMDHVDIWYLHREDLETPLSETMFTCAARPVWHPPQSVSLTTTLSTGCLRLNCCPPARITASASLPIRRWHAAFSRASTDLAKRRPRTHALRATIVG
jgi:hypothetical protein